MNTATLDLQSGAGDNSTRAYDVERLRRDFPILSQTVYGKPLVYLDNGASAQKPRQVIAAMTDCMEGYYANVHRGVHRLSQLSTDAFEAARSKVQAFIGAGSPEEIVFTRGGTEAINLVAASYGERFVGAGDEILVSQLEHHSNIVPWQMLCERKGASLKVIPSDETGALVLDGLGELIGPRTRMVAVTHISNALGSIVPVAEIIRIAHAKGVPVLVDGCQAVPHMAVDVTALDADFYVFSAHKLYGPTGIGVLYGKRDWLEQMPPYQGGGEMVASVSFETGTTYKGLPHRFEAGTPAIVEAVGMGAAVDYVTAVGLENIAAHEEGLLAYATQRLAEVPGLRIVGQAREKAGIISFVADYAHAHDIGTILDRAGVAVRAGHHCAQPVIDRYGLDATARASFGLYNTREEVDRLIDGLMTVHRLMG